MRAMGLREARVKFSAVVAAAENRQATIITRNGKPVAAIVPIDDARKLYPELYQVKRRNLAEFLLSGIDAPPGRVSQ